MQTYCYSYYRRGCIKFFPGGGGGGAKLKKKKNPPKKKKKKNFFFSKNIGNIKFFTGADLGGGGGVLDPPPLEFAKLNIADITGNEKISYFSYLCTSHLYVKVGPPPPWKNFLDPRL